LQKNFFDAVRKKSFLAQSPPANAYFSNTEIVRKIRLCLLFLEDGKVALATNWRRNFILFRDLPVLRLNKKIS